MASFNTMAGCFLASALFALVLGKVSNALVNPHHLEKPAIAVPEAAADAGPVPSAELAPIGPKLKDANVEKGKALYVQQCFTCHTIDKGGANKVGPNLWGVVNRPVASHEGYSYSAGMKAFSDGGKTVWDYEHLSGFLTAPKAYVKDTAMGFAGVKKIEERASLIAYLRTLADTPAPLPQ